jgi:hypothetical protein
MSKASCYRESEWKTEENDIECQPWKIRMNDANDIKGQHQISDIEGQIKMIMRVICRGDTK